MSRWIIVAVASLIIATGCTQAPTDKLAATDKAIEDARAAGAPNYMPEDFAKLEGMLTNAKNEIADQDSKFGLLRDYGSAEQQLAAVQAEADRVTADTAKKKEEAKQAALQAQQAAQASVKTTQDLVQRAPVGKDRAAVEAIKADARGLTASLTEVQTAIDSGDYLAAQAKAKAIKEKSQAVAAEIQTALAKVSKGKSSKGKRGR
jgi:chromosome segregation ATPase